MRRLDLNRGWQFSRLGEESAAQTIDLPHDAMLGELRTAESAGGINTGWFEGHDYRYTRTLEVPAAWRDKTVLLECEGVYHNAEVWVNGAKIAFRPYGYTNFYVELNPYLRPGEANELSIIARNADQPNSRWYSGAGLYRPVWLWLGDRAYLPPNAIRVRTLDAATRKIEIRVATRGRGPVELTLLDGSRELAHLSGISDGTAVFTFQMKEADLWSPERPKCYTCRASFARDQAETAFGIRTVGWDAAQGLTLNGQRVILRGACIHHDNGVLGACCYSDAEERKVRILKENGYNAIRSAHNPCSKALLEACDRLGMLVMDEYIDHWYIHKTEHDYVNYFADWWRQDLREMVDKDYNHPCVILYSTGNEVSETAQPRGIALTRALTDYLHSLDGTRPVTCGVNIFFNFLSSIGFGVYSDEKAKQEAERAEKRKQAGDAPRKKKAVGSQFFNDMAGLLGGGFMKLGATLHGCDVKTRDAFANMDIAGYNYGINRYRHDLKKYPDRLILGSETFCSDAYAFWQLAQREPRLVGDFVWSGIDYLGEVGVGSWEYADYAPSFDHGPGWLTAGSGRIDLTGHPLAEAAYTRVAFGLEEGPVLAVRPVNHTGDRHSPSAWKMTNAISSWSWPGCEGKPAVVEVYTRAARAALFVNGRQVGSKKRGKDCRILFRTAYESGTLSVITYDGQGCENGRAALHSAGAETVLRLEPEAAQVRAGGLAFIHLRYTDKNGITKPLEQHRIRMQVEGGRLLALGHACPYNPDGFLSSETDTYWGRALAVVQADGTGPVRLTAEDGQRSALTELPCSAVQRR